MLFMDFLFSSASGLEIDLAKDYSRVGSTVLHIVAVIWSIA